MPRPRSFDDDVVLDRVVERFWSSSYASTSTDELCIDAELSRSSLYNAFGSKRDLYHRSLTRYVEAKSAAHAELADRDISGREMLIELALWTLRQQWDDESRRACLSISAAVEMGSSDPETTRVIETNARNADDVIAVALRRGRADGSIRSDLPVEALARIVHATLDGLQVRSRTAPDREAIFADLDTLLRLL